MSIQLTVFNLNMAPVTHCRLVLRRSKRVTLDALLHRSRAKNLLTGGGISILCSIWRMVSTNMNLRLRCVLCTGQLIFVWLTRLRSLLHCLVDKFFHTAGRHHTDSNEF